MSRNAPPKKRLLTSELHSFLIVLAVCLRSIGQTNHIPENLNDVMFSRENVDVADDLASVTDHVGRNTEENCR